MNQLYEKLVYEEYTFKWADAFSIVVKTPEDSTTYSTPKSPQGTSAGSLIKKKNCIKLG